MTVNRLGSVSCARSSDHSTAQASGSASMTATRRPWQAQTPARCNAKVVLPTPPCWLRSATIMACAPGDERNAGFPAREDFPTTKNLESDLESLGAPDSLFGERRGGSLCARSPDRDAPEILISVAPEIPIAGDGLHS